MDPDINNFQTVFYQDHADTLLLFSTPGNLLENQSNPCSPIYICQTIKYLKTLMEPLRMVELNKLKNNNSIRWTVED